MSWCVTRAVQDGLPCTSGWLQGNVGCLGAGQNSSGRTDLHFRMAAGECGKFHLSSIPIIHLNFDTLQEVWLPFHLI